MRLAALAALALIVGVALVACGGGEEPSPDTGAGMAAQGEEGGASAPEASDPPAPGFRDSSGVTEIPAFGSEAPAGARRGAGAAIEAYLRAQAAGDWARACSRLSALTRATFGQLIAKLPEVDDCADALRLSVEELSKSARLYQGPVEVAALRIKRGGPAGEGAGFALFHGEDGRDYWITTRREAGEWKVVSTTPLQLR